MTSRSFCLVLLATAVSFSIPDTHAQPAAAAPSQRTIEARATAAIEEQGRAHVADLMRRIGTTRDAATLRALNEQVVQSKLDTELQLLRTRASYARTRGDVAAASRFDAALAMLLRPVIKAPVSTAKKGGQ